jgi:hypothetical protein
MRRLLLLLLLLRRRRWRRRRAAVDFIRFASAISARVGQDLHNGKEQHNSKRKRLRVSSERGRVEACDGL